MVGNDTHVWPRWATVLLALGLLAGLAIVAYAQEGDITRGAQLYDANCAVCHGPDGQGRVGVNLSQDFPSISPDAFLREIIANGVPGTAMPAWSQAKGGPLSDQDIADLVAFVNSLSGGRSPMAPTPTPIPVTPVPTVPGVSGDPSQGRVLFIQNCAMCHGEKGQGRIGANLSKAFASINPQQYVRTTVSNGIPGTVMPAWSQANGGPLSEKEIDDISAYIISLAQEAAPPSGEQPQPNTSVGLLALIALIVLAIIVVVILAVIGRRGQPRPS